MTFWPFFPQFSTLRARCARVFAPIFKIPIVSPPDGIHKSKSVFLFKIGLRPPPCGGRLNRRPPIFYPLHKNFFFPWTSHDQDLGKIIPFHSIFHHNLELSWSYFVRTTRWNIFWDRVGQASGNGASVKEKGKRERKKRKEKEKGIG